MLILQPRVEATAAAETAAAADCLNGTNTRAKCSLKRENRLITNAISRHLEYLIFFFFNFKMLTFKNVNPTDHFFVFMKVS